MGRKILITFSVLLAVFSLVFACFLLYRPLAAIFNERGQGGGARSNSNSGQAIPNSGEQGLPASGDNGGSGNGGGGEGNEGNNGNEGSEGNGDPAGSSPTGSPLDYSALVQPEELFLQYIDDINERNYEDMYGLLCPDSKASISIESFTTRNQNIYDGIGAKNIVVEITSREMQEDGRVLLSFLSHMDSSGGGISFSNHAAFTIGDDGNYCLEWSSRLIFPLLTEDDRVRASTLRADRGTIYDRNGDVLAGNSFVMSVGIVPGRMNREGGADEDKAKIAGLLGMSIENIDKRLNASYVRDDTFVTLKTLHADEQELAEELNGIAGIQINDMPARVYPLGVKAAHLTGYIQTITPEELEAREGRGYHSASLVGKTGLESILEERLRAVDGCEIYIINTNNEKKQTLAKTDRKHGENVRLTINSQLQTEMYDIFDKEKSCSVAMDPVTGEVLALVSNPSYDPNAFVIGMTSDEWDALNTNEDLPLLNRFRAAQAPGSSFKPVIGAIGVTLGSFRPNDNFGRSGRSWQNDSSWGSYYVTTLASYSDTANLRNALAYSDNIYFAKAAVKVGSEDMAEKLREIGFAEQLPFEYVVTPSSFSSSGIFDSEVQLADSGYGQGQILVNPVHLASIYTAFVNDGNIIRPRLIYPDGASAEVWKENAFSKEAVDAVRDGLILAIDRGTARSVRINSVRVAGKTGTAELKQSRSDREATELGWFALFTADRDYARQMLIVAMIEDVKGRGGSQYVIPKVTAAFSAWLAPTSSSR